MSYYLENNIDYLNNNSNKYLDDFISKLNISNKICNIKKCPNYVLCSNMEPDYILKYNNGTCNQCNKLFGKWKNGIKLTTTPNIKCENCYKTTYCIKTDCEHNLCLKCLKHFYFDIARINSPEPLFPFPEIKTEYYYCLDNEIVSDITMLPEVIEYKKKYNDWTYEKMDNQLRYEEEIAKNSSKNLCPVCNVINKIDSKFKM